MKPTPLKLIALFFMFIGGAFWLASCGSGGGTSSTPQSGAVGLFMTDDASTYQQVAAVINSVALVNSSDGSSCSVLSTPVSMNLSDLSNVVQLINTTTCPAANYNRLQLVFSNAVGVTNSGGISNACAFTSYRTAHNGTPNALSCSGNNCTLDITGAVNVLASQDNQVGLDFVLKDFDVNGFGTSACTVTMRVSPLDAAGMNSLGYTSGIAGPVTAFNANSVTMAAGGKNFIVNTSAQGQSNFQNLMSFARQNGFSAMANCTSFNFNAGTCTASQVQTIVAGTVSSLDNAASTFALGLSNGSSINVDFSQAAASGQMKGQLQNNQTAVLKLSGVGGNGIYNATEVQSRAGMGAMGNMPSGGGMTGGMPGGGTPMM